MTDEKKPRVAVRKRDDVYVEKTKTKIWHEQASQDNPYIAEKCRIHGYELMDLSASISFTDSIYLNIKGELPNKADKTLMDAIFVALSNLGPRHPATRAVMSAAVSKTQTSHLLPIGLSLLSGEYSGANEVEAACRFIKKNVNKSPQSIATQAVENSDDKKKPIPGFGITNGGLDIIANTLAKQLCTYDSAGKAMQWGMAFSTQLNNDNQGWRLTGIAAACFVDLGFRPKACGGLFQIAAAPGLLAHGLEMANKPITAMPFVDDTDYHYTKK